MLVILLLVISVQCYICAAVRLCQQWMFYSLAFVSASCEAFFFTFLSFIYVYDSDISDLYSSLPACHRVNPISCWKPSAWLRAVKFYVKHISHITQSRIHALLWMDNYLNPVSTCTPSLALWMMARCLWSGKFLSLSHLVRHRVCVYFFSSYSSYVCVQRYSSIFLGNGCLGLPSTFALEWCWDFYHSARFTRISASELNQVTSAQMKYTVCSYANDKVYLLYRYLYDSIMPMWDCKCKCITESSFSCIKVANRAKFSFTSSTFILTVWVSVCSSSKFSLYRIFVLFHPTDMLTRWKMRQKVIRVTT